MENRIYPLFDEQGKVVRATLNRAENEVAADHRFDRGGRAGRRFEARGRHLDSNSLTRVIESLDQQQMLPAIYFIFSRRGCEEAMQRCAMHGLDLTSVEEKARIAEFVAAKMSEVTETDEATLYRSLLNHEMLAQGISVHHAGLLPFLKELVEELFQAGLVKVVFSTETLSLGIHMPARSVVISSFTKFDGHAFPSLTSGQLTQLMGRAGRRGIDKVGHGVILKDPEVDIGVIYEAAMGEDMVVESKFAPNYNMALNLLRNRDIAEAELLMERCFGQFQRRQAAEQRRRELKNLEERLADVEEMAVKPSRKEKCRVEEVQQYFADEAQLRNLRNRVRRAKRDHYHRGESGLTREQLAAARKEVLEIESRHQRSPVRRCPNLQQHRAWQTEVWALRDEIRRSREEIDAAMHDYTRHLHSIIQVLEEAGFLYGMKPSDKGLLASRIYGENSLILSEALYQGWLDHLEPAELCAVLVILAAEDRGRPGRGNGRGGSYARNRFPTAEIRELYHSLRSLHLRFSDLEEAYGEQTLRPLSRDYVDFTYRWARGEPLDQIPLPPMVEFGDAIKAIRSLYSTLRQLEWAISPETPLRATVYSAMRAMERDLIRRV
jgi:ATP-dependent RNA helicase HelY